MPQAFRDDWDGHVNFSIIFTILHWCASILPGVHLQRGASGILLNQTRRVESPYQCDFCIGGLFVCTTVNWGLGGDLESSLFLLEKGKKAQHYHHDVFFHHHFLALHLFLLWFLSLAFCFAFAVVLSEKRQEGVIVRWKKAWRRQGSEEK